MIRLVACAIMTCLAWNTVVLYRRMNLTRDKKIRKQKKNQFNGGVACAILASLLLLAAILDVVGVVNLLQLEPALLGFTGYASLITLSMYAKYKVQWRDRNQPPPPRQPCCTNGNCH